MKRSEEITNQYFAYLEKHIHDVISGIVPEFMEVNEIAGELAVSHKHLTDTVKKETGQHPCYFYDQKIIREAQQMLLTSDKSIAEIARIFTYDPSNFSKFFKKMTGFTPGEFRLSDKK
ncbi:AraC family transcriptional regulator [Chryseobacterium lactis]|uniref:AraC family transcriptional regulator n=1 Tax=Chryseobacterium lactis TaxID=1241981 RepID=A0A3G6RNK2_CHRLC|nr:AraC family transcriptional regulator [Chryseobacterium lactis]AZA83309.1 AraC family transcriptional regulator [Chryseobacterium lactis]AZB03694.1 AraC family transcriptional regulator [Chryseobacterium lactis]PNW11098.1 AraC family transcriptional regulator [Chryseobacterium lactis]